MIRLYIPEPLAGTPLAQWFMPTPSNMTYKEGLPPNFFETEVERVTDVAQAQAIVLPNNFKHTLTPAAVAYIQKYADLGEKTGKPVCLFSLGDLTDRIAFDPRVYALRFSLYKHAMGPRDVCITNQTEDNAADGIIATRTKQAHPKVSFCGMGDLASWRSRIAYVLKNVSCDLRALSDPYARAHKLGVYWRRAVMNACTRSSLVETNFIVRKTFSGNKRTIELDPAVARKEYLDSIVHADFVLAPKGDGNYSNRFLKTLCMGRIPVIVDTDIVLPLEDIIDYSKIVVRVPMKEVYKTPQFIRAFYDGLTNVEWQERQKLARATFEKYLKQDIFLRHFFSTLV